MFDWKKMRGVLSLCIALGWWGIWFPELAVWTEAVCVVDENTEQSYEQSAGAREIYNGLLHAQRDHVQIKSRLLQIVEKYFCKK